MNKELKAKWVRALRSGKYKQGTIMLWRISNQSYCCLGVLCTIVDPNNDYYWVGRNSLPNKIKTLSKIMLSQEQLNILMKKNDSDKQTFEQIADYIEKTL